MRMRGYKRFLCMLLTLSFVVSAFAGCGSSEVEKKESDDEIFKIFSYDLFKQVSNEKNPIVSPVSAYLALAMAGAGADGASKEEFDRFFGKNFLNTAKQFNKKYNVTGTDLKIKTSDAAWISKNVKTKMDWTNALSEYFNAKTKVTDLTKKAVVKDINRWVSSKTNGLIKNMVDEPFSNETMMALFNAIYFKGKWINEFEEKNTRIEDFTSDGDEVYRVAMMHLYGEKFRYVANNDCTGAILPYKSGSIAMLALKPKTGTSTRELLSKMDSDYVSDIINSTAYEKLNLKLPKFTIDFERELKRDLKAVGFDTIFDEDAADFTNVFSKIKNGDNLYISLVKQKAKIIVDEKGTEAAAATEVDGGPRDAAMQPIEMFFDEPFVYMIIDTENQVPLFMGILDKPNT